ncbi:MAG: hypothetical protein C4293_02810 [Nitrospiraceae bacterium]
MLGEIAAGRRKGYVLAFVMIMGVFSLLGCTAERPAAPSPTQREIRSNSDRFFEKMKQEEHEHKSMEETAR